MQGHPPVVQNLPGLPSFTPISTVSHNHMVNNQFSVPLRLHPQLRAQPPNLNQMVSAVPEHSGLSSLPSARPHSLGGLQMPPVSSSSFRPFQAPSMQPAGAGTTITQNANLQPTFQSHPMSDSGYQVELLESFVVFL